MAQINKKQAGELLGLTKYQMNDLVHEFRSLGWPHPVRKQGNVCFYLDNEVVDWYKHVVAFKEKNRKPAEIKKLVGLDTKQVFDFLTNPPPIELTMAELSRKHAKRTGKTVTQHLEERDDYAPPRGVDAFSRRGGSYRVAHDGGGWL